VEIRETRRLLIFLRFSLRGYRLTGAEVLAITNAGAAGKCTGLSASSEPLASKSSPSMMAVIGQLLIRTARFSGPGGTNDWYVELFNNSDLPATTTGLVLGLADPAGRQTVALALQPGRVIAPRGSYLIAGSAYWSGVKEVMPDQQADALPFEQAAAAGLFAGKIGAANRLDAIGLNSLIASHFYEGSPLPFLNATMVNHAFVRRMGANRWPQDTQNNSDDFVLIAPSGRTINGHATVVGLPNPQSSFMAPLKR
jgi:hypothetical protein